MGLKGAGVMGDIKKLRNSLKRTSNVITTIPPDGEIDVQFLEEPTEWFGFQEHYMDNHEPKYFPCSDDCDGCAEGERVSDRWLAHIVNITDNNKVQILKLPKTLVESLTKAYDRFGTLLGRDFSLTRSGQGIDTTYSSIPLDRRKIRMSEYQDEVDKLDFTKTLEDILGIGDDDEPVKPSAKKRRPAPIEDDDEDDYDDEEDDDQDDEPPPRKPLRKPGQARREREVAERKKFAAARRVVDEDDDDEDDEDEDDEPVRPARRASKPSATGRRTAVGRRRARQ